jgi:hypothetical protein
MTGQIYYYSLESEYYVQISMFVANFGVIWLNLAVNDYTGSVVLCTFYVSFSHIIQLFSHTHNFCTNFRCVCDHI